jgi:hypothetical protein
MVKINQENFSEALNLLEDYQNNKSNNDLGKVKKALEKIIRDTELFLGKSNSEFTEYLISSGINFQDIFDEIDEFNSQEEVENKEKEYFPNFLTFYLISLLENAESINNWKEIEELISILEIFQKSEVFPLPEIYQENQEKIEDIIVILNAKKLSLGEQKEEVKEVIPSSSKGKQVENKEDFDWTEPLSVEELRGIVKQQAKIIEQKNQEISEQKEENEKLKEEVKQLKEQLVSNQVQVNPK